MAATVDSSCASTDPLCNCVRANVEQRLYLSAWIHQSHRVQMALRRRCGRRWDGASAFQSSMRADRLWFCGLSAGLIRILWLYVLCSRKAYSVEGALPTTRLKLAKETHFLGLQVLAAQPTLEHAFFLEDSRWRAYASHTCVLPAASAQSPSVEC